MPCSKLDGPLYKSAAYWDLVVVIAKITKISKPISMFVKNLAGLPKLCIPFAILKRKVVQFAKKNISREIHGDMAKSQVLKVESVDPE